ncbi:Enteropeptidase [Mactra antiquata]
MIPCLNDGKCIPVEWWCDNMEDCEDGTDESSCNLCKDDELQCINGTCINSKQRCDGIKDCPYGTDERSCVSISDENLPVMINIQNKWSPLCYDDQVADRDDQLCNAAGYRSSTDLMVQDNQYYDLYSKIQTGDESLQFSSSPICQDQKTVRLQCSETDCGQNGEHLRNKRIVGGNIAMKGSWPWSVAVRIGNNVVCGGSIISDRWVVTAGHCVHDLEDNPQVLSVIAGVNDIQDDTSEVRYISEVINHPQYNYIFHADIALLRLESPLIFNKDIQPICLPWDRRQFSPLDICFVTGYGVSNMTHYYTTITPRYLRQVKTKIIDQQLCETMYSYKSIITDSMLCAGYTSGGMDTCKGDSGGGLMCQNEDGRWLLAGVISWGDLCGSRNRPGVYTNILSFIDWIGDQTNPNVVHNVTCDFEQNWCGYQPVSTGKHIWTRKPGDKYVKGRVLVAAPTSSSSPSSFPGNTPTNVSLFSPTFTLTSDNCMSLNIMFSRNSQITVTVYGKTAVTQTDQSGTTGQADTVLFKMTSSYPAMNVWKSVEINIPSTIGQFVMVSDLYYGSISEVGLDNITMVPGMCQGKFAMVSDLYYGGISEVGLDNITMVPGMCQGSNIMDCDFDDATLCFYSQSFGDNKIQWEISHDTDGNHLKTGGDSEDFGYQTVSQLISPVVASDFISIPHCLTFTYNKITNTKTELVISTYITIVGELANPHVYWTSESSPIGTWRTQNVTIAHDIFDHVVFEVRRIDFSTDRVEILLDDIKFVDGICV